MLYRLPSLTTHVLMSGIWTLGVKTNACLSRLSGKLIVRSVVPDSHTRNWSSGPPEVDFTVPPLLLDDNTSRVVQDGEYTVRRFRGGSNRAQREEQSKVFDAQPNPKNPQGLVCHDVELHGSRRELTMLSLNVTKTAPFGDRGAFKESAD